MVASTIHDPATSTVASKSCVPTVSGTVPNGSQTWGMGPTTVGGLMVVELFVTLTAPAVMVPSTIRVLHDTTFPVKLSLRAPAMSDQSIFLRVKQQNIKINVHAAKDKKMGTLQVDTAWVLYVRATPTRKSPGGTGVSNNYMRLTEWHKTPDMTYKLDVYCGANDGPMCQFHVASATDSSGDYEVGTGRNRYWYSLRADAPQEFFLVKNNADGLYALFCYGPDDQWISTMGHTGMTSVDRPTVVAVQGASLPASYTACWSTMALSGATPPFAGLVASADAHLGSLVVESTANSVGVGSGALVVRGGGSFDGDVHVSGSVTSSGVNAVSPFEVQSQTLPAQKLRIVVSDGITPAGTEAGQVFFDAAGTNKQIKLENAMWNDAMALMTLRLTGLSPALRAFVNIQGAGGIGNIAVQQLIWDAGETAWLPFTLQIDHQWSPNTAIDPHIHVAPLTSLTTEAATFDLVWEIRDMWEVVNDANMTTYLANGDPASHANTFNGTVSLTGPQTALRHRMLHFGSCTPALSPNSRSAVIVGALRRRGGTTYAGQVALLGFDFHVQNNSLMGDLGPYPPPS